MLNARFVFFTHTNVRQQVVGRWLLSLSYAYIHNGHAFASLWAY